MEHNLCIHVLNQIAMQAGGEQLKIDREKMKEREAGRRERTITSVVCCGILTCSQ